jgi:hypothetical protein
VINDLHNELNGNVRFVVTIDSFKYGNGVEFIFQNKRLSSRNDQQYAQICTTSLFYIPAPTCFGSSLPSLGSFWIRLSYMKIQIDLVVYHIMLVK